MPVGVYKHHSHQGFQKGNHPKTEFKKGCVHSEKSIEKMRETKMNHFVSIETKEKQSKAKLGTKNYRWIKDRSILERNKRNDPEYKQWVRKVKKRDNNVCQLKNKDCAGYNIVHHIKSWSQYPELRYKVNNGITLCQYHHPRKRDDEQRLIPVFQKLVGSN